jgi:hypothetical protein
MSNALRRNKKPTFYTKQEMRTIGRNDFEKRNADKVISKSYKDFVVIGYIILHDKFGFGQTRIIRLQDFSDKFIDYIDTLANYKQFQLTVPMIAESLAEEIKFVCDLEV